MCIQGSVPAAAWCGGGARRGDRSSSLEGPAVTARLPVRRLPLPRRSRSPFTRLCRLQPSWD